jgi:hypothetical protein
MGVRGIQQASDEIIDRTSDAPPCDLIWMRRLFNLKVAVFVFLAAAAWAGIVSSGLHRNCAAVVCFSQPENVFPSCSVAETAPSAPPSLRARG